MQRDTYGRAEPCPNCGSHDVRWRKRRWNDVLFTWLRYGVESILGIFTGPPRSRSVYLPESERRVEDGGGGMYDLGATRMHYGAARRAQDERMALATARWFWRCRACKQHGETFDAMESDAAASLELGRMAEESTTRDATRPGDEEPVG